MQPIPRLRTCFLRHQQIGKTHGESFVAGDTAAGIKHQRRLGLADDRRERDGQSESRMKAKPKLAENRASAHVTRKSATIAKPDPPPTAAP